jgi:hypothetical protein
LYFGIPFFVGSGSKSAAGTGIGVNFSSAEAKSWARKKAAFDPERVSVCVSDFVIIYTETSKS